jgi:hypothetical protein
MQASSILCPVQKLFPVRCKFVWYSRKWLMQWIVWKAEQPGRTESCMHTDKKNKLTPLSSFQFLSGEVELCSLQFPFYRWLHGITYVYVKIYKTYVTLCPVQHISCLIFNSFHYNGRLVTWTLVWLTAAKFKQLIFLISRFALSNDENIRIFIILYDFCFFRA